MNQINIHCRAMELLHFFPSATFITLCKEATQYNTEFKQTLNTDLQQAAHGETAMVTEKKKKAASNSPDNTEEIYIMLGENQENLYSMSNNPLFV